MRALPAATRQLIRRLFLRGLTVHAIARRVQISRSTVQRITQTIGRRRKREPAPDDPPPGYDAALLRRCPGCGGLVYVWPCLTCRIRALPPAAAKRARAKTRSPLRSVPVSSGGSHAIPRPHP